jgi:hypothetical protein
MVRRHARTALVFGPAAAACAIADAQARKSPARAWTPPKTEWGDPDLRGTWIRQWTVSFPVHRTEQPMYEYACHDGNAPSMEGLLRSARVGERDRSR